MIGSPSLTAVLIAIVVLASGARWRPRRHRRPDDDTIEPASRRRPRSLRRHSSVDVGAATALERVARDVRSGSSLTTATAAALTEQPGLLADVRQALQRGASMAAALGEQAATHPAEAVMVQALRTSTLAGGPVADTLERGAAILRERQSWAEERRAQGAQARLSATLLTLVPVGFASLGFASSSRVRAAYADVPATVPITTIGVALNIVGWWWMRRLVEGAAA